MGILDVGLKRIKITVDVAVGSGVSVLRGVAVKVAVGVAVGLAAEVWVEAALAVCAIIVPIALGSTVGMDGAASVGTQAMTAARAVSQNRNLVLRIAIFPLAFSNDPPNLLWYVFPTKAYGFSTMIRIYG